MMISRVFLKQPRLPVKRFAVPKRELASAGYSLLNSVLYLKNCDERKQSWSPNLHSKSKVQFKKSTMTDSPLVTRQSRDKLARKPLRQLAADTPAPMRLRNNKVTNDEETPNNSENGSTKKRTSRKNLQSPPSDGSFCASSPIVNQDNQHPPPPEESIIAHKSPAGNISNSNRSRNITNNATSDDSKSDGSPTLNKTPGTKRKVSARRLDTKSSKANLSSSISREIEETSSCLSILYVGVLVALIGITIATYISSQNNDTEALASPVSNAKTESFKRFARDLDQIRQDYPKQNVKTWASISGQLRRNLFGQSTQPLCFLFVYNATVQETTTCLLKSIGSSMFYALNGGIVEGQLQRIEAKNSLTKGDLFDLVDDTLRNDKVVVIDDISKMNAEAIMALHGICDEGYMPSDNLKPVILMTISAQQSGGGGVAKSDFEIGANLIKSLWESHLGTDKIHPLISRIASVVIKILPDNKKC